MLGKPKFVSVDDFKNYWGLDLRNILRSDDNESNQAERFLARVEDRLMNWIDNNTFRRIKYEELRLRPRQYENWQKAILTQAMYMYKNGDLGIESGLDTEKGIIAARQDLVELEVSQAAIDYLSNAGLFNLNVKNRPRWGTVFYGDIGYFEPTSTNNGPVISNEIAFSVRGQQFANLCGSHYLEVTEGIFFPLGFWDADEYLINIRLNDDIKQIRFTNNIVGLEKYGTTIYSYGNINYELMIYVVRSGPTIKIRSAVLSQ